MLWTLILSFTIGGGYVGSGTYNASKSSVVVPIFHPRKFVKRLVLNM